MFFVSTLLTPCWLSCAFFIHTSTLMCTAPPPKSRASLMTSPSRRSASTMWPSRVNKCLWSLNSPVFSFYFVFIASFLFFFLLSSGRTKAGQSERRVPALLWSESRNHRPRPLFSLLAAASKGWWEVGVTRTQQFLKRLLCFMIYQVRVTFICRHVMSCHVMSYHICHVAFQEADPVWTDEVPH